MKIAALPFHSAEFSGRTMSRYGVVLDAAGQLCTQQVSQWVMDEAVRAGWRLVQSNHRDEGMVWAQPKEVGK